MNKLTSKQKIFCDEYLIDLNATRAYKKAYPSVKKDDTAAVNGNRLLRNAKVKEYIDKRMKDREKRTEITQDMVLKELAAIAFSNGADFAKVTDDNIVEIIPTDELPIDKKKAISAIKETKFGINIETCDKVKALELLGKHLGMFKDKLELSGNINNPYEGLTTEQLLKIAGVNDG
ncbi:MAG: terminase small subunit [Clostridium butyricum]|nr:terminase small subunit [Clostridium butyricum]